MTHTRHPSQNIKDTLHRMSLDELVEARRLLQTELDRRQGREKFTPVQAWPDRITR